MDVITLSSDSDHSSYENEVPPEKHFSLAKRDDEIFNIPWCEEVYPAINYDVAVSSQKAKVENDFISPEKHIDQNIEKEELSQIINSCSVNFPSSHSASESETTSQLIRKRKQKLSQKEREQQKILRDQRKIEREKQREEKKAEQSRRKALKAALFENQRNLKPEENIKFLKVHIDNEIINSSYGINLITLLQQNNIQFVVESQIKSYTITWSKSKTEKIVNGNGDVEEKINNKEEKELLYILHWLKAVELIHNNELLTHVQTVKSMYVDKKLTLIIYGLEKYFNFQKVQKKRTWKAEVSHKGKPKGKTKERNFGEAPHVTKDELEYVLTELQLLGKHNSRLLETPEEFSSLILNMTKSLSQVEYRVEKNKRQEEELGWIASDSCHSVKIDKNGDGLLRLWQQQICQFSSVGLETAQAIVSEFRSPLALVTQYRLRDAEEGERLLENIQIRRDAGILSSSRRIGPQLSKKIFKFFTSDDPNTEL